MSDTSQLSEIQSEFVVEVVDFVPLEGCGAQIGWLTFRIFGQVPAGMQINRMPLFCREGGGETLGMPLAPVFNGVPVARYSAISFDTDENRQRFIVKVLEALRLACPDAFGQERAP